MATWQGRANDDGQIEITQCQSFIMLPFPHSLAVGLIYRALRHVFETYTHTLHDPKGSSFPPGIFLFVLCGLIQFSFWLIVFLGNLIPFSRRRAWPRPAKVRAKEVPSKRKSIEIVLWNFGGAKNVAKSRVAYCAFAA